MPASCQPRMKAAHLRMQCNLPSYFLGFRKPSRELLPIFSPIQPNVFFSFNFTLSGLTCLALSRTGGSAAARSRAAVNWCHKTSAAVLVLIYSSPDSQMESRHDFLSRKLPASSWDVLKSGLGKCWREHFPAWASPCRATAGTGSS